MKIAIIGTGNLGLSIAKGIIYNNLHTQLYLTKRNPKTLVEYKDSDTIIVSDSNTTAVKNSDIILFAVQPHDFSVLLQELHPLFHDKHLLISTVTGVKINAIEQCIGTKFPIVRAMPNTAIAVSQSMSCLAVNSIGKKSAPIAEAIFKSMGETLLIDEALMQSATVLCASGIAFWMRCIRAFTQGGVQMGFDAHNALKMSVHTALGAASLLLEAQKHPEEEIDKVTTPRGCTITGLNEMEHQGLSSAIIKGLLSSYTKINTITTQ